MDAQEMAKAIRNIALSGVMLLTLIGSGWATEITEISMTSTSGTLVMKRVEAKRATVSNTNGILEASGLTMSIRMSNGEIAEAESEAGIVIISGDDDLGEELREQPLTRLVVQQYGDEFERIRYPGDILLEGGAEEKTKARLGKRGEVETQKLIWSEAFQKYFLPNEFQQQTNLSNGSLFRIEGACAVVNREFNDWTYYGGDGQDAVMTYERPDTTD